MGLPCFLDEVPEYDCRHGRVYITAGDFALAMPIHVFLAGCARGKSAVEAWQNVERGRVVRMERH